jgi:hypothetical protein
MASLACASALAALHAQPYWHDEIPDRFASEKELKEKVLAAEWLSHSVDAKQFFISRIFPPAYGRSRERVSCWLDDTRNGRVIRVWDISLRETGPVDLSIDKSTSTLTITGLGSTPFQGKVLATVSLAALGL